MDFILFEFPSNLPLLLEEARVGRLFKLMFTFLYELLLLLLVVAEFRVDLGEYFVLLLFGFTILFKLTIGLLFDPDPPTADDAAPEY